MVWNSISTIPNDMNGPVDFWVQGGYRFADSFVMGGKEALARGDGKWGHMDQFGRFAEINMTHVTHWMIVGGPEPGCANQLKSRT